MAATYLAGIVTTVPFYDTQAPHYVANVINWHTTVTGLTQNQLSAIQGAFNTSWATGWGNLACSTAFYRGCVVLDMATQTGLKADNTAYVPTPGTAGPTPVGDQVALLISLHGLLRYRGGHSRIYIPGMATVMSNADGRSWTTAALAQAATVWANLVAAMAAVSPANGGPLVPVIWHKKKASMLNTYEAITGATPQPIYATQRRRVRKVSRHKKKTP